MTGWQVYILRCSDGTLYTGITVDLPKRLDAHQRGVAAKYTRARRPVSLVYQERQPDRSSALTREANLRRLGRAGKLAMIRLDRADRGIEQFAAAQPRGRAAGCVRGRRRRCERFLEILFGLPKAKEMEGRSLVIRPG